MIPAGLETMEPGLMLGAMLATINVGRLSGHDRVIVLQARQRMASHYQAQVYADMTSVVDAMSGEVGDDLWAAEAAAAEIRVALRLTRRAADSELALALDLKQRLPRVFAALDAGDIDMRRARTLSYGTSHLGGDVGRRVADRALEVARRLTTGQLGALIRRLCLEVDPDDAKERYRRAVEDRRLVAEPTDSGTANLLGLDLPPDRVSAVATHINEIARSLNTAREARTMDQLRADVFLDILEGKRSQRTSGRGSVDIRVDLETLAGLKEHPGDLAGYGPVIADIARRVSEHQQHAQWRFSVTDPATGRPLLSGTTRRRPTAGQRRLVEARDPTCVFPGCRMPAAACDLDHSTPWSDGGSTAVSNLAPLCRHDHRIRHEAGWTHEALPNGDHQWTTRLGHVYTTSGAPP